MKKKSSLAFGALLSIGSLFLLTITMSQTSCTSPTAPPTPTPAATSTFTPTSTPSANVKFDDFEAPVWLVYSSQSYMAASQAGYDGNVALIAPSTTIFHSSTVSLQATESITNENGYGYLQFFSGYASGGWGFPINVQIGGTTNPTKLSLWVYSEQATHVYLGVLDNSSVSSLTTAGNAVAVPKANTWTNIVVPLTTAVWDANISTISWTALKTISVACTDDTVVASAATPNNFDFNVDDVYFY